MKKSLLTTFALLAFLAGGNSLMAQWAQYNADALPQEDPTVNVDEGGMNLVTGTSEIVVDPDSAENNLWKINVEVPPDEIKHQWYPSYWDFASTENVAVPAPSTIAVKFRWINDDPEDDSTTFVGPEIEFRSTSKVQTKIYKKGGMYQLKAKDYGLDSIYMLPNTFDPIQWHVLRLTLNGDVYNIYLDENPTPAASGISAKPLDGKHLVVFGAYADDGIRDIYVDWMGFLESEASSPTEMALPAGIFELNPTTDINDTKASQILNIYPNPSSEILIVSVDNEMVNSPFELMDITGRVIHKGLLNEKVNQLDVSHFNAGMYFLRVSSGEKVISNSFIVK